MFLTNILLALIVLLLVIVIALVLRSSAVTSSQYNTPLPPVIVSLKDTRTTATPPFDSGVTAEKAYGNTTLTYRTTPSSKPTAAESLNRYYTQASRGIPTDFTMESCSCPFSKPQKTDLPVPSMPTCMLLEQSSYKLSEFKS